MSNEKYFNVKVSIITNEKVEIIAVENRGLGYDDCSEELRKTHSTSQTGSKFNSYSITLNCFETNSALPIDLKIDPTSTLKSNNQSSETKHSIQISLSYTKPLVNSANEPLTHTF